MSWILLLFVVHEICALSFLIQTYVFHFLFWRHLVSELLFNKKNKHYTWANRPFFKNVFLTGCPGERGPIKLNGREESKVRFLPGRSLCMVPKYYFCKTVSCRRQNHKIKEDSKGFSVHGERVYYLSGSLCTEIHIRRPLVIEDPLWSTIWNS